LDYNPKKKVQLIFVIPDYRFETFDRQRYLALGPAADQAPELDPAPKPTKMWSILNNLTALVNKKAPVPEASPITSADHPDRWIEQYALKMDTSSW
jgi:hypothetical protein